MLRTSLVPAMALFALVLVPPADAQRRQAEIVQGVTNSLQPLKTCASAMPSSARG